MLYLVIIHFRWCEQALKSFIYLLGTCCQQSLMSHLFHSGKLRKLNTNETFLLCNGSNLHSKRLQNSEIEMSNFSSAPLLSSHHIQYLKFSQSDQAISPFPGNSGVVRVHVCLCWPFWSQFSPLLLFVMALFVLHCIQYPYYTYTKSVAKMTRGWLKILKMREWENSSEHAQQLMLR